MSSIKPMPQEFIDAGLTIHDVGYDLIEEKWVVTKGLPTVRVPVMGTASVDETARDMFDSLAKELVKLKRPTKMELLAQWSGLTTLRDYREGRGVKLCEVARHVGVSRQTYSRWEKDIGLMPITAALGVCEFLGLTFEEFEVLLKINALSKSNE